MFTGIISETGTISSLEKNDGGLLLKIETASSDFFAETKLGDSVAINGVCLTVTDFGSNFMEAFAQIETLEKTTLGDFEIGQDVNLEHPLRFNDRLGGHLVQGHVDGVATIHMVEKLSDGSWRVGVKPPQELMKYISKKGSVTLDGVSLTIASINDDEGTFDIALIPATLEKTQFGTFEIGTRINIEADCLARMVERLLGNK